MNGDNKINRITIILLIIGSICISGIILLFNWDKIFLQDEPTTASVQKIPINKDHANKESDLQSYSKIKTELPPESIIDNGTVDSTQARIETNFANESTINTKNTAQPNSSGGWNWTIFLDTDHETLLRIKFVEYTLHSTFSNPVRTVNDQASKFALNSESSEAFEIKIKVVFKDNSIRNLKQMLKFQ